MPGKATITREQRVVSEISEELIDFISANIDSVVQLRVLLLVQEAPERDWTVDAVCGHLSLRRAEIAAQLARLVTRGFLAVTPGADPIYHYAPRTPNHASFASLLAQLDRERPVTLINLIY